MNKFFKYIGLISILLFSFYYTDKLSYIVNNNSRLVTEINDNKINYDIKSVSALIDGDYIIPGLNGYAVDVLKSYDKMKYLDSFNSYYLEYDIIKPSISLENNKEKIIKYGNKKKNEISIIIKDNKDIIDYINRYKINITRVVDINTIDINNYYEQINGDISNYKKIERILNRNNINKDICVIDSYNKNICIDNNKYLVEPSVILNNYNISNIISEIKSGYIIYINDDVSLENFKMLLKQINYKNINVVYLSKLISEEIIYKTN